MAVLRIILGLLVTAAFYIGRGCGRIVRTIPAIWRFLKVPVGAAITVWLLYAFAPGALCVFQWWHPDPQAILGCFAGGVLLLGVAGLFYTIDRFLTVLIKLEAQIAQQVPGFSAIRSVLPTVDVPLPKNKMAGEGAFYPYSEADQAGREELEDLKRKGMITEEIIEELRKQNKAFGL